MSLLKRLRSRRKGVKALVSYHPKAGMWLVERGGKVVGASRTSAAAAIQDARGNDFGERRR